MQDISEFDSGEDHARVILNVFGARLRDELSRTHGHMAERALTPGMDPLCGGFNLAGIEVYMPPHWHKELERAGVRSSDAEKYGFVREGFLRPAAVMWKLYGVPSQS